MIKGMKKIRKRIRTWESHLPSLFSIFKVIVTPWYISCEWFKDHVWGTTWATLHCGALIYIVGGLYMYQMVSRFRWQTKSQKLISYAEFCQKVVYIIHKYLLSNDNMLGVLSDTEKCYSAFSLVKWILPLF